MHDIDRVLFEMDQMEAPTSYELAGEQQESLEADLAGRLLEVSSEQELDHFLGSLLSRAASAFGLGNLDAGRALGGLLKGGSACRCDRGPRSSGGCRRADRAGGRPGSRARPRPSSSAGSKCSPGGRRAPPRSLVGLVPV